MYRISINTDLEGISRCFIHVLPKGSCVYVLQAMGRGRTRHAALKAARNNLRLGRAR